MPTNRRFAGGISLTAAERGGEEAYYSDVLKYVQMSSIYTCKETKRQKKAAMTNDFRVTNRGEHPFRVQARAE